MVQHIVQLRIKRENGRFLFKKNTLNKFLKFLANCKLLYLVRQLLVDGRLRGVGSLLDIDVHLEPEANSINFAILVFYLITLKVRAE